MHPNPNRGYAWHWWTYADGTFTASGANGQTLYVDRENDIVVARASAWPAGYVREHDDQSFAMYKALADWLDRAPEQAAVERPISRDRGRSALSGDHEAVAALILGFIKRVVGAVIGPS